MKRFARLIPVVLLVAAILLPVRTVAAAGNTYGGQVLFGQSFTLESGDTMNGDLMVMGGSVAIEKDAKVNGNVFVMGGGLDMEGEVTGDVAVVGGSVVLGSSAHVHGNLTVVGTTLVRADGALVDGQVYNAANTFKGNGSNGNQPQFPITIPSNIVVPPIRFNFLQGLLSVVNAFLGAIILSLFAMLVMLFLAPHADRVAHTVAAQPFVAGGLGLLTVLMTIAGIVFLALTLILAPVAALVAVALLVAGAFGWISIGYEIGQRFTRAIHQEWHPAFSAGLGVFALTLIASALTNIPVLNCVGWLFPFVLGLAALGAVVMTRFGTQGGMAPAPVVPLPPQEPTLPAGKAG